MTTDIDPRRLNAALAVGLFGWTEVVPTMADGGLTGRLPGTHYGDYRDYEMVPDYLTWEGMRLVVEAMRGRGWRCILEQRLDGLWVCWFENPESERYRAGADADTAPLAVAHAARRALGVSLEGMDGD